MLGIGNVSLDKSKSISEIVLVESQLTSVEAARSAMLTSVCFINVYNYIRRSRFN